MKKKILPFAIALLLFSCGGETQDKTTGEAPENVELIEDGDEASDLLASNSMDPRTFGGEKNDNQFFIDGLEYMEGEVGEAAGSYVGDFGKNMINITIFKMADGEAEGYSVCAGNFRKITGTYKKEADGHYKFEMKEPGDDKYDGTFKFTARMDTEKSIAGTWTPFNEGQSSKKFQLEQRFSSYDPTVGKYPQASQRELTDDDLNNLLEEELTEMRNEIYARHGYSFKNKDWRYHFEALDWYMPTGIDVREKLSDTEVDNISLIYEYESYFQDYYDDYGR